MSSCLSGGGGRAAYGFDLDIVVKSSSSSPTTSSSRSTHSSPSSTLSEACNSPLAISTKRARTPRKRPNQTYNEAAALLSTVYPNIFSAKSLPKLCKKKNPRPLEDTFSEPTAELLPTFPAIGDAGFLLQQYVPDEPSPRIELRPTSSSERSSACLSPTSADLPEANSPAGLVEDDDFDAESILDEEVGEGIDSIMGNLSFKATNGGGGGGDSAHPNPLFGYGIGGIFKFRHGYRGNMRRALKRADDSEWWRSPTVEVLKIAPKLKPAVAPPPSPTADKKKKKKVQKVERVDKVLDRAARVGEKTEEEEAKEKTQPPHTALKPSLSLKLNYEDVLKAWSGRGLPSPVTSTPPKIPPTTLYARLSQIVLFPEAAAAAAGGVREASVLRYKEKRRTRLFSKKIRYQVRKVNADRRPRMKASVRALSLSLSLWRRLSFSL
ncbi:unnamed protein product [Spirodela intermedia]|uniref:CCT domain-containing protein n=1 Tax=Spirodela intermedia TaxID=51605 RepID=A0A7I8JNV9_SPIIN|nr:unnamed protein product [Spirodela intermedia]CAA6671142.1 unnamed protein product [Spirodela intermedia]